VIFLFARRDMAVVEKVLELDLRSAATIRPLKARFMRMLDYRSVAHAIQEVGISRLKRFRN
jgi:hypothetical protein